MSKDSTYRIYLATENKKRLGTQLSHLSDHFDLLPNDPASRKQWKLFLASPYYVQDPRIGILFDQLYTAHKREAAFVKSSSLLPKLFGRNDYEADKTELRRLIRDLQELILQFCQDQYLRKQTVEQSRLRVEMSSNHSSAELYEQLLSHWHRHIEQEPEGTRKPFPRWRMNHQRLISTQRHKQI